MSLSRAVEVLRTIRPTLYHRRNIVAQTVFPKLFPFTREAIIYRLIRDRDGILVDVGCGTGTLLQGLKKVGLNIKFSVGMDVHLPYLRAAKQTGAYEDLVRCDARYLPIGAHTIDLILALEVIEHLTYDQGEEFLSRAEGASRSTVLLSTPRGFACQEGYDDNAFQKHLSAYYPEFFRRRGYRVYGAGGLKLRTGRTVSDLLLRFLPQVWVFKRPQLAEGIVCIRENEFS